MSLGPQVFKTIGPGMYEGTSKASQRVWAGYTRREPRQSGYPEGKSGVLQGTSSSLSSASHSFSRMGIGIDLQISQQGFVTMNSAVFLDMHGAGFLIRVDLRKQK